MTCSLLLLLLLLLMVVKNSDSSFPTASADTITVHSGAAVRLSADLTRAERERLHDLRWKHPNGQLILKGNMTNGEGGRCELLADGSLSFSRTETRDSGKYLMRAFDKDGTRIKTKEILLQVNSESWSGSRIAVASLAICCFLLLGFTVSSFVIKRRAARSRAAAAQENVYVEMRPCSRKEEESYCALFNKAVSTESPVPQLDSPDVEDVYV